MDKDIMIYMTIGIIIGFIIGVIFMTVISPNTRKYSKIKQKLSQTEEELSKHKQMIVRHFSHSAEILDNMAQDFRRLYQHMVENTGNLLKNEDIPNLDFTSNKRSTSSGQFPFEKQPKDYSDNPSGLLKKNEHKS